MNLLARFVFGLILLVGVALASVTTSERQPPSGVPDLSLFFYGASADEDEAAEALEQIASSWRNGYVPIFRDFIRLLTPPPDPSPRTAPFALSWQPQTGRGNLGPGDVPRRQDLEDPATRVWRRRASFISDQTGLRLSGSSSDLAAIQQWMWAQPYDPHPYYTILRGFGTAGSILAFEISFRPRPGPPFGWRKWTGAASR